MSKSLHLDVIDQWPTLTIDPVMASIGSTLVGTSHDRHGGSWDATDNDSNDSILAVADDLGYLHCYLDGTFPLGAIFLGPRLYVASSFKDPGRSTFFVHLRTAEVNAEDIATLLPPTLIDIPLLNSRQPRDLAKLSSTARELVSYLLRVVMEMKSIWNGSDAITAARHLGDKWVQALEARQRDQFGKVIDITYSAHLISFRARAERDSGPHHAPTHRTRD